MTTCDSTACSDVNKTAGCQEGGVTCRYMSHRAGAAPGTRRGGGGVNTSACNVAN